MPATTATCIGEGCTATEFAWVSRCEQVSCEPCHFQDLLDIALLMPTMRARCLTCREAFDDAASARAHWRPIR